MSNALAPSPLAAGTRNLPEAFANRQGMPDLNAAAQQGVAASFAVIGYKGRNWRIKYQGEEVLLRDARGTPLPVLDVIIVGVSPHISKVYYEKRYSEGDQEAPNCWSSDGQTPDITVEVPQSPNCVACPNNKFGSRITEAGKKAKACQDTRRLAVVPAGDTANSTYGGPMLLRLPPMSLPSLSRFAKEVERYGAQLYEVQCQLGFDYDVAYPLVTFTASGWVQDNATATAVRDWANNEQTQRVISFGGVDEDAPATEAAAMPPPSPLATPRAVPPAFQPPVAPVVTAAPPPPPPPPVVAAPPPPAELPFQFTADGKYRWRPGMDGWEPVPVAGAAPAPATPQAAPAAAQTAPVARRRGRPASAGAATSPGGAFSGPDQAGPASQNGGAFSAPTPQAEPLGEAQPIAGTVVVQTSAAVEAMVDKLLD